MSHFEGLYCQSPNSKYTMFPTRIWDTGSESGEMSLPRWVPC